MRNGWRWSLAMAGMLLVSACHEERAFEGASGNPPRSDVRIELRPVAGRGEPGVEAYFADGRPVKLANPPVFTTSAIARVGQMTDETGTAQVYYEFTESAAPRIQSATERLVGRAVVLTVDGEPISTANVAGPFGKGMVTSGVEPEEAVRLVTRMTGKP